MNLLPNGICSDWSFGYLLVSSDHRCGLETVEFCELVCPEVHGHPVAAGNLANVEKGGKDGDVHAPKLLSRHVNTMTTTVWIALTATHT